MKEEARIADLDAEFMSTVQNLVNQNDTFFPRVPLTHVKDLFNELSDRIENLAIETPKASILALLRFGIYLTQSNTVNEKVQNLQVALRQLNHCNIETE